ncbi:MAG: histidine kinase [Chitinophagaceae bacterium]|nr:histidine kinase [Chitinophagaceae bacterium]
MPETVRKILELWWLQDILVVGGFLLVISPFFIYRFYRQRAEVRKRMECVNMMELSMLRSQLNPHFLFNTFNNLYGISLHEPQRVPDLIMQISRLMRYQLESICKEQVCLKEEMDFVESFIALEEERVAHRCKIEYDFRNDTKDEHSGIAPMMLLPFIENAFKHGANSIENCFVRINIKVCKGILQMDVVNSIPKARNTVPSTQIGLRNTEQRLKLSYPDKYELTRNITDREYSVRLVLDLNSDHG